MQNTGMQGSSPGASTAEKLAEQASAGLARLSETAHETMGRVSGYAQQAASRLSERGEDLMQSRAFESARGYVRQHPIAAIGIAIAVGLLLSKLTSRR
ncbi:MAG TPA: hypothetical protein VHP37_03210 [Burkholderiales bacterium]|nr:hypothetical protein [Burkholderiales bacterium]